MNSTKKKKAVFLDRDGVINQERGMYTSSPEEFILNEGIIESIQHFKKNNFLVIVVTNQGGIAKGIYSINTLNKIHEKLNLELEKHALAFDEIYFCPHHPSVGACLCRKPGSLLLEKALARFDIDPSLSYFIGDADRDVQAAQAVGVNAIKIIPNENLISVLPKIK